MTILGSGVFVSDSRSVINTAFSDVDSVLANKVNNPQVLTDVPLNAIFTDTIFIHPSSDGSLHVIPTSTIHSGYGLQAGSTAGSLTWVLLDKTAFGVNNLDNTADLSKPISSAQQIALNAKAGYSSPTFTGIVTGTFSGVLSGNADTATKTTQDGNGNVITSTYITLSTTGSFTASTATTLTPVLNSYFPTSYSIKTLNQTSGVTAGTYSLQSILQALVYKSHTHTLSTVTGTNCNCACNCDCSSDGA